MKILCESISKNIKIIKLDIDNLNQKTYSNLLQTKEFWNLFHSEKIFLYQEDTLVFKDNIEDFIEFDFIGAILNTEKLFMNTTKKKTNFQNDNKNTLSSHKFTNKIQK